MNEKIPAKDSTAKRPGRPRTKPAEVRLDELMAAAEKLFLEKGVDATTINDIVESAQVAKGTFYHYFSAKTDLLEALGKRYTTQFMASLELAMSSYRADDWVGRLQAWVYANVETYVKTYRVHDIVYTNHHHHDRSNQAKNAILDQLLEIIDGGCRAGIWSPPVPRVVALLIYSGVHGATDDVIAAKTKNIKPFAQSVSQACLQMLSPTKNSAA